MLSINIAFALFLSIFYFYVYRFYSQKYMGIWALSWFFMGVRIFLDALRIIGYDDLYLLILNQIFSMFSAIFLVYGIYQFHGKGLPKAWIYFAVSFSLLNYFLIFSDLPFVLLAVPTASYVGLAGIWTGIMFYRIPHYKGYEPKFLAIFFILIGIENMLYPIIPPIFFFSISSLLWIAININILLFYFQKSSQDLSESEEKFRLLAENAKDIIFRYSIVDQKFVYISPAVESILGYHVEEFYHNFVKYEELIEKNDQLKIKNLATNYSSIKNPIKLLVNTKKGRKIWTEIQLVPIMNSIGDLFAFEGIIRDVTERVNVENEMKRLNQLHMIGETAATIAHEIRNPMTTVHGFLQLLSNKTDLQNYKEWIYLMVEELDRANHIIKNYLSFSKAKEEEIQECQLNEIITELYPLLESSALIHNMMIELDLQDIPKFSLNKKEIHQLILNFAQNGLEAMRPGGIIKIKTWYEDKKIHLSIEDQGEGISTENLDKIGTPFFTTKDQGTGLGLAVCYRIAEKHNASITVKSDHLGTRFTVHFDHQV